jgi:hypothetical protein
MVVRVVSVAAKYAEMRRKAKDRDARRILTV